MLRLIGIWLTLMTLLSACGPQTAAPPAAQPPAVSSPGATALEAPAQAGPAASSTPEAPQPTVAMAQMQPLAPDSFSKAKPVHEFWPDVQKAAKLYAKIQFGTSVTGSALSPDGRYVAVAGCDVEAGNSSDQFAVTRCEHTNQETSSHAYFFVFDAANGDLVATLPETGQILTVSEIGFTHDGKKLLYSSKDAVLQIWDMQTSTIEANITQDGAQALTSYDISPDDRWLVVSFDDKPIRIWDMQTKQFVADLPSYGVPQFGPDGRGLLVFEGPYLTVYDTTTWKTVSQQAMLPDGYIMYYDVSSDYSIMAICDRGLDDQPVRIWDVATATLLNKLPHEFGKCGRLLFTPDGQYLVFFNNHGAGPMVWSVDGWKYAPGSHTSTNFVGSTDLFVDRLQFTADQTKVLVPTFSRLTLYALPAGEAPVQASGPPPTARPLPSGPVEPPPMLCDMTVTGALKLQTKPCDPPRAQAGYKSFGAMEIQLLGPAPDYTGVFIYVPDYLEKRLKPGTYKIGDATIQPAGSMYVVLDHTDSSDALNGPYYSYSGTGEIVITEVGAIISGTFKFGAHNDAGHQVNVAGTFTNIPNVHTYRP